jgi:hypothetical protein
MKMLLLPVMIAGLAVLSTGCGGQNGTETTEESAEAELQKLNEEMARESATATQEVSDAATQAMTQATSAVDQAATSTNEATASAQTLLDQARSLISEGKYAEALTLLQQQIGKLQLTPEQQKTLNDLMAQAQKGLATNTISEGTKAVGDLLNRSTR